jgi:hypothetical protein
MVTSLQPKPAHTIKLEFSHENTTALGGLALCERLASRLGLWKTVGGALPRRQGQYDWPSIVKSLVHGLLSGSRGTWAAQDLREDKALLGLLGLTGAPEEATVWRALEQLGEFDASGRLARIQNIWTRRILSRAPRRDLLHNGFVPVFGDGTLLEGSGRREGTKYIEGKGAGLLWNTVFVGPLIASQRLARAGEGEQACVRAMLPPVIDQVLRPLKLHKKALALLDSLHGDDPTLDGIEQLKLHYIVGANKLAETDATLQRQPDAVWESTGANRRLGWADSAVCTCWIQCRDWPRKRLLVGRRWRREGEFLCNYAGVITDLAPEHVAHLMARGLSFARAIWRLYDAKAGLETQYKDALIDLGLHRPPCREHVRNAGFYAVATLAHTLGVAVDLIGGRSSQRGSWRRTDGGRRKRATPRRMRLWRLRRRLLALPVRVATHARTLRVTLLGLSAATRDLFERYWGHICRC